MPSRLPFPPALLPLALCCTIAAAPRAWGAKPSGPTVVPPPPSAVETAEAIDAILVEHWRSQGLVPAERADDGTLLRRLMLDLHGRLPTVDELDDLQRDADAQRIASTLERLLADERFSLHFAWVVDAWVQGNYAGDDAFVGWLRQAFAAERGWDDVFRAMLVGPWQEEADRPASKFLQKRAKNLDALTADSARVFFGVDISCARCHDHPLVDDWKQRHYYGLAAFFGRTKEDKKAPGGVVEKNDGEVTYSAGGKQATAALVYLNGATIASAAKESRRERLVRTALDERRMFSRAAVNRVWAWFFGRGLIHPVDQMHAANVPSVPRLLDRLADDFSASGYDLRFLCEAIVRSRAYQMSSRWTGPTDRLPPEDAFAVARLRPLTREQFACAAEQALGPAIVTEKSEAALRRDAYLAVEKRAGAWWGRLDPPGMPHQSSAAEALFLSNHATLAELTQPRDENLAARLIASSDDGAAVELAFRTLLARSPNAQERRAAIAWLQEQVDRTKGISPLLWSLVTSAEFRFNH
jgi:hypothetical protein